LVSTDGFHFLQQNRERRHIIITLDQHRTGAIERSDLRQKVVDRAGNQMTVTVDNERMTSLVLDEFVSCEVNFADLFKRDAIKPFIDRPTVVLARDIEVVQV
jgi:hypothetical protein